MRRGSCLASVGSVRSHQCLALNPKCYVNLTRDYDRVQIQVLSSGKGELRSWRRRSYALKELEKAASGLPASTLEALSRVSRAAGADPLRAALLTRGLNALAHSTEGVGERSLSGAASALSDYLALLRMLESPEVLGGFSAKDPLADARLRCLEAKVRLLEDEGWTLSADEAAASLRISREAVNQRRRSGKMLALSTGLRGYRYPVWQFGEEGVLPGFEPTLKELSIHGQWGRVAFFLVGNELLDGLRSLDLLRRGRPEDLEAGMAAARARGEQVAG